MAKKYIDAEKLKAEVKRYKNKADERLKIKGRTFSEEQKDLALQNLCGNLLHFITSLQQEQPIKVYRVENEKESKGLWRKFDGTWEPLFDMLTDGQCKDMPMKDIIDKLNSL